MQLHMVPLCVPGCKEGESGAENLEGVDMGLDSVLPAGPSQCHLGDC